MSWLDRVVTYQHYWPRTARREAAGSVFSGEITNYAGGAATPAKKEVPGSAYIGLRVSKTAKSRGWHTGQAVLPVLGYSRWLYSIWNFT